MGHIGLLFLGIGLNGLNGLLFFGIGLNGLNGLLFFWHRTKRTERTSFFGASDYRT